MEGSTGQLVVSMLGEIRAEISALRSETAGLRTDLGERLAVAESQIEDVLGNGQPGRLKIVEDAVAALLNYRFWLLGVAATVGVVAAIVGWAFPRH
jgi:uncharacterized protein involved in exopolysaccharide biosynthesis